MKEEILILKLELEHRVKTLKDQNVCLKKLFI